MRSVSLNDPIFFLFPVFGNFGLLEMDSDEDAIRILGWVVAIRAGSRGPGGLADFPDARAGL